MEHTRLNLAFAVYQGRELPVVKDGDIISGNLAQMYAGTEIWPDVKDLLFEDCNLVNVKMQPTWKVSTDPAKTCNCLQNDYDPTEIFPDESVAREQAQREAVKQRLVDAYAAEVEAATADIATADLSVDAVKAVIAAKGEMAPIKERV